ncbi:MAG: hypothetical protein GQ469_06765 [Methanosarcinales archaeon]|jgi:hypothetical protein|nr:hypothetical protein [Methanosarcinales archaeon]
MLLLSASLAGVAVCEDETGATGGYTVTPAKDAGIGGSTTPFHRERLTGTARS